MTMQEIEKLTQHYADAREALAGVMGELEEELAAAKRSRIARIRRLARTVVDRAAALQAAITQAPQLFEQPRTRVVHGIRVGYQKGKGSLRIPDEARTIDKIRELYTDEIGVLVRQSERVNKTAIAKLSATELKKLGVEVEDVGDQVVIRAADSDIDKMVDALLKELQDDEGGAAAA